MKNILVLILLLSSLSVANERYIRDNTKEVVLDTKTNLLWQDNAIVSDNSLTKTWSNALTYCENLNFSGFTDWKLPNYNELYYLADRSKSSSSISEVFQNVASAYHWTSTTSFSDNANAWAIFFSGGNDFSDIKTDTNYVRCVRVVN